MLLRQMKYFASVVKNNSFTEAAEECYISQSAISQQIQALENELGVTLLVRENRKFHLTIAGEYFYRQCVPLLEEVEELRQETIRIARQNRQQLRIGYLKSYGGYELQHAVAAFAQISPDTELRVINGTHEELYDALRFDEVDLIFNDHRRAFSTLYENFLIFTAYTYIELSEQNSLNQIKNMTLEKLRRTSCILISSKGQRENEQDYYQNTLNYGGNFLFAENLEEARMMVVANQGFLPVEGRENLPQAGSTIYRIPLVHGKSQITRDYYAFWKKDKSGKNQQLFADLLKAAFVEN